MDPASIVLAVLPLIAGAVKAYKLAHKKLKVFRHYSREVGHIRKRLDCQSQIFTNEIHLCLRKIVDDEASIQGMLKGGTDKRWMSEALETGMRLILGSSYDSCRDILDTITATIKTLEQEQQIVADILDANQSTVWRGTAAALTRFAIWAFPRWYLEKGLELVKWPDV